MPPLPAADPDISNVAIASGHLNVCRIGCCMLILVFMLLSVTLQVVVFTSVPIAGSFQRSAAPGVP